MTHRCWLIRIQNRCLSTTKWPSALNYCRVVVVCAAPCKLSAFFEVQSKKLLPGDCCRFSTVKGNCVDVFCGPSCRHTRNLHSDDWREFMRRILLVATPILLSLIAPTSSRADAVGAAFGAGVGLVAGPPGAVVGGVIGAIWGRPFWGPPNSPHACWIDNSFYRHCRYYGRRWHYY
jgi:osmotically inducible lipoprotein OsmB